MNGGLVDVRPVQPAGDPATGRRKRWWTSWLWCLVAAVAGVAVAASATLIGAYTKLSGNIKHVTVDAKDLGTRPAKVSKALNILMVGSDTRAGANVKYGHREYGERTDTIILAHISPSRDNALLISFPRDSLVQLPSCPAKNGLTGQRAHIGMINESFNFGGIGCTWKTIESLTGIRIDHFVKVDFTGFKSMVNALGGVEICVPKPIDDTKALLHLPAGRQTLKGEQALGYVRVRYSIGDGSDIGRIQRQQMFLASMVKKAMSGATLTDPAKLFGFLDAATKSVTTDPELTLGVMKDLATSAQGLAAGDIHFITTPWRYSLTQPGRVEWVQPQARQLFRLVATDTKVKGSAIKTGREAKVPKAKIEISVQNGTARAGLGAQVAAALEQRGYNVVKVGDAKVKPYPKTTIKYAADGQSRVPTLAGDLVLSRNAMVADVTTTRLVLVIGADWKGLKPAPVSDEELKGIDATQDSCSDA
ncbi:LCP family protein [Sphaerisporangium krabiense]|uniref:LCP family protein required for cell wall assembly n=1 Tax=Sphaerisporangium krabiense TaxID=763782 RepID=A0A7W8Z2P9_9ACTN|nr:LCP family protein [Sphaerisporangium krabiense]MBB5626306.1 LCP family protein required for cell wall assembly [Sphaerisporangium krabiense]